MARPTALTPEVHEQIVQLVRAGMFLKDAAAFAAVGERTIYDWIERGQAEEFRIEAGETPNEGEQKYVEFSQAIEHARAYANITDMNVIGQAAQNDPHWAKERLRLRNPWMFKAEARLEIEARTPEQIEEGRRAQIARGARNALRGGRRSVA